MNLYDLIKNKYNVIAYSIKKGKLQSTPLTFRGD